MAELGQQHEGWDDCLPLWVVDSEVKSFLEEEGIEVIVYKDSKFLSGASNHPLVILRRACPHQNETARANSISL
jgi:hypothetical protein